MNLMKPFSKQIVQLIYAFNLSNDIINVLFL